MRKKYSFFMLMLFALAMGLVYLVTFIQANFEGWYYIVGAIFYIGAGACMATDRSGTGWYLYMLGLIMTIVIFFMVNPVLETLPMLIMALFLMIFLLEPTMQRIFGVEFTVSAKKTKK